MTIRDLSRVSCLGYCRVSLERQAGEVFTSLDDQKRAIAALAAKHGHSALEWFVDAGASGGTMERPEFRAMFSSCEKSPRRASSPGFVIVLNSSRWARTDDPEEAAFWRVRFRQLGWIVRYAENDDSDNVTLRHVMRAIGEAQSTEYRQQIKNNAKRGAKGAANQGFWRGRAPFGYRRAVVHPKGRERILENGTPKAPDEKVILVPDAVEGKIVREIFQKYSSGAESFETLARHLSAIAPRIKWCASIVGAVLRNPVYAGDVVGGRRLGGGRPGNARLRPQIDWYGKPDAHEALVDRQTFAAVQGRLGENRQRRTGVRSSYVVSGLVHCNTCGRPMVGGGLGGRLRDGARPHYYRCSSGLWQRDVCPGTMGTVMQHLLEGAVISTIAWALRKPSVRTTITRAIDDAIAEQSAPRVGSDADPSRIRLALQRRDRLVDAVANGTLTDAEASRQLLAVRSEIDRLDGERQRARFPNVRAARLAESRDSIVKAAADFPAMAKRLSGPALREFLRPWIAGARFDKKDRYLYVDVRCVPALASLPTNVSPDATGREQREPGPVVAVRLRVGGKR